MDAPGPAPARRHAPGRRGALTAGAGAAGCVAAALACAWWLAVRPPLPLLPTDDLYTHLGVTRHLARGEGFLSDIAYPLSFAWPFARTLPQPLVHRPPAWPVVLLLPYAAAGGEAEATIGAVRALQAALLAAVCGLGTAAWWRRGRPAAATAWLLAMLACPLWRYAVDWGLTEVGASLLLLGLWLRRRDDETPAGAVDGVLLGLLALLRPELAWLPVAWWAAWPGARRADAAAGATGSPWRRQMRRPAAALLAAAAIVTPWGVRNLVVAGDPFFSVQAQAELLKDTRTWPGYDVYRQLSPQPAWRALAADPVPVARKAARGVRFFAQAWPGLVPWPVVACLGLAAWRRRREHAGDGRTAKTWRDPAVVACGSTAALALMYACFDHSLRHLLPVVPILAWEAGPWLGEWPWRRGSRPHAPPRTHLAVLLAVAVAAPPLFLTMRQPAGWREAAAGAAAAQAEARAEAATLRAAEPGEIVFVRTAAATWLADRPAVWSPLDDDVATRIRAWLADTPPRKDLP